jgi:hypothetical protein
LVAIRPSIIITGGGIIIRSNQASDEMSYRIQPIRIIRGVCLIAAAGATLAPDLCTAELTSTGGAIDQNTSQAILQELKEIRRVLEKIERGRVHGLSMPVLPALRTNHIPDAQTRLHRHRQAALDRP